MKDEFLRIIIETPGELALAKAHHPVDPLAVWYEVRFRGQPLLFGCEGSCGEMSARFGSIFEATSRLFVVESEIEDYLGGRRTALPY